MPVLRNPRHEKFAQLVASGIKPTEAYVSLGYSEAGAPQSANNLLKRTDVRERVNEIQSLAAQSSAEEVAFDQKRVLNRLDVLSRKAEECGQISAAVRCEELIGKQRGMFVERSARFLWSGRLADLIPTLNPEQLLEMENEMLEIAAQGDPVKFAELRKQLETCPVVIDAESTPVETRST
jgi:hypothetical protein